MSTSLKKWLEAYDQGKTVESVSMGGMGVGYETVIQEMAISAMRNLGEQNPPEDAEEFQQILTAACEKASLEYSGCSGAQYGAAKNIVAVFWRQTPEKGIEKMLEMDPKRVIQIQSDAGAIRFLNSSTL